MLNGTCGRRYISSNATASDYFPFLIGLDKPNENAETEERSLHIVDMELQNDMSKSFPIFCFLFAGKPNFKQALDSYYIYITTRRPVSARHFPHLICSLLAHYFSTSILFSRSIGSKVGFIRSVRPYSMNGFTANKSHVNFGASFLFWNL